MQCTLAKIGQAMKECLLSLPNQSQKAETHFSDMLLLERENLIRHS
jgi:hypothetical protein